MTVELCDAVERPTAVVAATTTWPEFPRLWKALLDEVYTVVDGPFEGLHAGHRAVLDWCAEHGHALSGVRWGVYRRQHPDPAQLQTEICWALATGSTGV